MRIMKKIICLLAGSTVVIVLLAIFAFESVDEADVPDSYTQKDMWLNASYKEVSYPTPNIDRDATNRVEGVILHHTAEPTAQRSLSVLTSVEKKVGSHVVIDTDGTRYILADPIVVTYHAGLSILNNREGCNYFTIGIEFQGNTLETPLTDEQIASGIEYLLPIIRQYKIPISSIVTHEMVRTAYKQKYPNKRCYDKVDITQTEYLRFMKALKVAIANTKVKN